MYKRQTLSSASVGSSKGADNSGSEETSGASIIMQTNLIYNHDLLANALILNELGLGTEESEGIAKRFELNTCLLYTSSSKLFIAWKYKIS